ncbi:uncharacterized protein RAG0_13975 [Rhynchosporium agropyri]|uniref:Uncharacterized protein n=1 Tax=Rhynchosporium agropyri TaxID=914238 RepID=A0A1E1LHB1_9HELO|nr:uncharacterized protein RAG0_13975 [Rhynchosporium agropyri]
MALVLVYFIRKACVEGGKSRFRKPSIRHSRMMGQVPGVLREGVLVISRRLKFRAADADYRPLGSDMEEGQHDLPTFHTEATTQNATHREDSKMHNYRSFLIPGLFQAASDTLASIPQTLGDACSSRGAANPIGTERAWESSRGIRLIYYS